MRFAIEILLPVIMSAVLSGAASAATYRCTDANGSVTYTSRPCPTNAKSDKLGIQPRPAPAEKAVPDPVRPDPPATAQQDEASFDGYRVFRVVSPADGTILTDTDELSAVLHVEPVLRDGHWIAIIYDGRWAGSQPATNRTLGGLRPGVHTLSFEIHERDNRDRVLASTPEIIVEIR